MTDEPSDRRSASVLITVLGLCLACLTSVACSSLGISSEADRIAREFVDKTFSHCGDSYFGTVQGFKGNFSRFVEIKGLSVSVRPIDIQEADKLNGYDWSGEIAIRCSASREFEKSGIFGNGGWADWHSGCGTGLLLNTEPEILVPLSKRNGQWFFYAAAPDRKQDGAWADLVSQLKAHAQSAASYTSQKPSCGEIPSEQ